MKPVLITGQLQVAKRTHAACRPIRVASCWTDQSVLQELLVQPMIRQRSLQPRSTHPMVSMASRSPRRSSETTAQTEGPTDGPSCDPPPRRLAAAPPGRLDARRHKTREALLKAGQQLFSQKSADGVSVDDIVQRAKVAKGTFYNHFEDKDDLAREIYSKLRSDIENRIGLINDGIEDPARRSCRALCTYARLAVENPAQARLIARLITQDMSPSAETNHGVAADATKALSSGRYNVPSVDSAVVLKIGMAHAVIMRLVEGGDHFEAVTVAQQICTLKLRALGVPPIEAEMIAAQSADEIIRQGAG